MPLLRFKQSTILPFGCHVINWSMLTYVAYVSRIIVNRYLLITCGHRLLLIDPLARDATNPTRGEGASGTVSTATVFAMNKSNTESKRASMDISDDEYVDPFIINETTRVDPSLTVAITNNTVRYRPYTLAVLSHHHMASHSYFFSFTHCHQMIISIVC
jgi:hypothetical protein